MHILLAPDSYKEGRTTLAAAKAMGSGGLPGDRDHKDVRGPILRNPDKGVCFVRRTFLVLCVFCLACVSTSQAAPGVFGREERPATQADAWHRHVRPMWERVVEAEKTTPGFTARGEHFGPVDAPTWRNLVAYVGTVPEMEMFRAVNGYFNQWRPKSDADTWDTPEYWASPIEFISQRGGDCEDYAIAKYFALRFFGITADRLRIVIIRSTSESGVPSSQLHAVLTVRAGENWFILDNNARPKNNIFPQTQYKGRFVPMYSMNENGAWIHGEGKDPGAPQ